MGASAMSALRPTCVAGSVGKLVHGFVVVNTTWSVPRGSIFATCL